jgi:hypothetical protein
MRQGRTPHTASGLGPAVARRLPLWESADPAAAATGLGASSRGARHQPSVEGPGASFSRYALVSRAMLAQRNHASAPRREKRPAMSKSTTAPTMLPSTPAVLKSVMRL